MGSKTLTALIIVLLVVIVGFVAYFAFAPSDEPTVVAESDAPELLPPPDEPIDTDAPGLEVRDEEEDLETRLDEEVAEAKEEAEAEASGETKEEEVTTEPASRDGWQKYTNTFYDYSFEVPSDWHRGTETTATSWVGAFSSYDPSLERNANDLPGAKIEVLVQENTEGLTLDDLAADTRRLASEVHEEGDRKLGSIDAKFFVIDMPKRTFVVTGLRGIDIFTVSFIGNEVDAHRGTFDGIIESFAL